MRPAKASPFGRGVCAADGEGKPGTKEHLHSDKHWLLIESSYRCVFVLSQRPCPLRRSAPAPPKGEPLACRSGFHWTSKVRCLGNGSAPLSRPEEARQGALVQKLLPSVARPALLRPVGPQASSRKWPGLPRAPPLGELSPKVTERARTARSIASCFPSAIIKFLPLRSSRPEGVFSFSAPKYAESLR